MSVATVIPDVRRGVAEYLKSLTDAGDRVRHAGEPPRRPIVPRVVVEHAGDIQQVDTRVPRGRVFLHAYGNSNDEAWKIARQLREAMLPPANVVWGVRTTVEYRDEEGNTRTITLDGAQLASGPREAPDSRTRVITEYLVDYKAA